MFAHRQLRLHAFVLVAFVYQMNVCPCGHLEHNGWYQLAKSCLEPQPKVSAPQESSDVLSVDSEAPLDCDSDELTYIADQRVNFDSLTVTTRLAYLKIADQTDPKASSLSRFAFLSEESNTRTAPELRAKLQVFLL